MKRDFTYIDDLITAIGLLIGVSPRSVDGMSSNSNVDDSRSPVAPFRVVNIGNSQPIQLLDFVGAFEKVIGIPAVKNFMPMQSGDVLETWADTSLLEDLTGFKPSTRLSEGVRLFVQWYLKHYKF